MRKYTVELTGHTRYFAVVDEEDREFLVVQFSDENSQSPDWEVTDEQGKCVGGEKRGELIEAVEAYIEKRL